MLYNYYFTSLIFLAGICFYSAVQHCTVEGGQVRRRVHLFFAVLAFSVALSSLSLAFSSRMNTVAGYVTCARINVIFNMALYIMFPWFFAEYSGVRPMPVLTGSTAIGILLFYFNLIEPSTVLYSEIHGLASLLLPWGEEIHLPIAAPSIWGKITAFMAIFMPFLAIYMLIRRFQRDRRRTIQFMIFAVAVFIASTMQAALIRVCGVHGLPPLGMFGFLGVIIIMGMTLKFELREDRRRAEEALRQSEARLNATLSSMKDIIFEIDLDGRFEGYFAPEDKRLFVQPDYFIGKKFDEVLPGDVSVPLHQAIESVLSGNSYNQCEYSLPIGNTIEWEHAVITPRFNALHEIIGFTAVCRNITERKRAEEIMTKLSTSLAHLSGRAFFEAVSGDAARILGLDYVFVGGLNPGGQSVSGLGGYAKGEPMGPLTYNLSGTPCDTVISKQSCYYSSGIRQLFPRDELLQAMGIEGYMGSPLFSKDGQAIGIMVGLHESELTNIEKIKQVFSIYTDRVAAELQRSVSEAALRDGEAFRRQVFYSSRIPIIIMDANTYNYIDCNPAAIKIYGYTSKEEVLGLTPMDVSAPVQYDGEPSAVSALRYIERAMQDGSVVFEWRHRRPDGTEWDAEVHLLSFEAGGVALLQFSLVDITGRKHAEEALKESEAKYRFLADNVSDVNWAMDVETMKFTYVSPTVKQLRGYTVDEVLTQTMSEALTRESQLFLANVMPDRLADFHKNPDNDHIYIDEISQPCKNGNVVWTEVTSRFLLNGDGKITVVGASRNISERKKAEEEIAHRSREIQLMAERLHLATRAAGIGIWDWDILNNDLAWDDSMYKLYGIRREDFGGAYQAWSSCLHPEDRERTEAEIQAALNGEREYAPEFRIVWPDGSVRYLSSASQTFRDGHGKPVRMIGTNIDITDRKLAEERQARLAEQLHQAQKMDAIGQLAGGVAHDFNNMLGGIMGAAQLLQNAKNLPGKQQKYISMILNAAERAGNLTKKLLTFSRSGAKASTAVDFAKIINDTVGILQHTIDKNIAISVENRAAHTLIIGDDSLLQNALINMGINASHAMPHGGALTFSLENVDLDPAYCEASSFDLKPGTYLKITVRDTGCGMAPEVLSRIFEPFFTTKDAGKGTGLGLAMVYGTVQEHGGAVTAYSGEGEGTVFHIYLPVAEDAVRGEIQTEELPTGTGTVLFVDDEELIRITAGTLLQSLGYRVLTAVNGEECVKTFAEKKDEIDLVILDMVMPVMGGREAFMKLREIDRYIPVLVASGFAKEENMAALKEQGFSGFLQKPFRLAELAEKVHEALKQKKE